LSIYHYLVAVLLCHLRWKTQGLEVWKSVISNS